MGHIRQTWLLKDSKTWSKKDAGYLVESLIVTPRSNKARAMRKLRSDGIYTGHSLGLPSDSKRLSPVEMSFYSASSYDVYKLGWTFFQKEREEFHCRETMTYNLQRSLVDTGSNIDTNKMSLIREWLPKGKKHLFLEEHWPKYIDAFLDMCGVSKNIRRNFTGYNNETGFAVFPASIALWRSTFFTAPSAIVGLMRLPRLFIKPEEESLCTIPEILERILNDKKESWGTGGKRMYKYGSFGINSMLWFSLLWIDKLRAVCDNFNFDVSRHYADGPNNFISATKESTAKILSGLDKEERKEIYTLLGNDKETFNRVVSNFQVEIRNVLADFSEVK